MEQEKKIGSAQEEIEYLKQKIAQLEKVAGSKERQEVIKEAIKEHLAEKPEKILSEEHRMAQEAVKQQAERIRYMKSEKEHEVQIKELLQIAHDKGIFNAVSVAKHLDDPHLEDDFHKALINYIQSVHNV